MSIKKRISINRAILDGSVGLLLTGPSKFLPRKNMRTANHDQHSLGSH
ncbi:hypothetical protein [Peribacillus butanolivorans]